MRYLISILLFLTLAGRIDSQINMKPLWWNIMRVQYTPGEPPPPPVLGIFGYGINAAGASVGDPTVTVTNTSGGTGTGSLRWALETSQGTDHKFIVFDIPGAGPHTISITIDDGLVIDALSFVTIDGGNEVIQITTPDGGDGGSAGLSLRNSTTHHVIVKNLYFINCGASDNDSETDGLNVIDGAHDIAITNCVFYGNTDGNVDFAAGAINCTLQYSIIGNHVYNSTKGSGGTLITTTNITLHHNLYNIRSDEEGERAPLLHGNYDNAFADIRYNIIYNFGRDNATGTGYGTGIGYGGSGSGCGCYARANIVNNYYYTPSTAADQDGVTLRADNSTGALGYSAGNISGNGFNFNAGVYTNHAEWPVASTFQLPFETTCNAVANVLANVGPQTKSAQATALIAEVTNLGSCSSGYPSLQPKFQWFGATFKKEDKKTAIPMMEYIAVINRRSKYLANAKIKINI